MSVFLLINGPNLNLLGSREPEVYEATRLSDIEAQSIRLAREPGHELHCFQSNAEHELIDRVQQAAVDGVDFIILNPGGFTHTRVLRCATHFLWFGFRLSRFISAIRLLGRSFGKTATSATSRIVVSLGLGLTVTNWHCRRPVIT